MMGNRISPFQLYCLLMFMIMSSTAIFEPPHLIRAGGNNGWILAWFCALVALPYSLVYSALASKANIGLVPFFESSLGKWLAKALILSYLFFLIFSCALGLRMFFEFALSVVLFVVPVSVFAGFLLAAAAWAARRGLATIGRLAEVFFWTNTFGALLTAALSCFNIDWNNFLPFVPRGILPLAPGAWKHSHVFAESYIAFFLSSFVSNRSRTYLSVLGSVLSSAFWICVFTLLSIGVFNHYLAGVLSYPIYSVVRNISVGDFIERVDAVFVAIWITNAFVKTSLLLFVIAHTSAAAVRLRDYRFLVLPFALLIGALSIAMFRNTVELKFFYDFFFYRVMLVFAVILPLVLLILSWWRRNECNDQKVPDSASSAG
ncbi:spore germination protein [Syntrophothermus lipocalidus DSM 12680]|uniref:Spore germination protein n=2 Tax=Syntrophothermus TaxID=129001 RepID=D7CJW9_SYNLT|nr:spore germination protein [Syntrophothermus lipocalidus DSM 12680]